jgi:hypothetical protein
MGTKGVPFVIGVALGEYGFEKNKKVDILLGNLEMPRTSK